MYDSGTVAGECFSPRHHSGMKRRNFILGGGLLASLSLGATATNASLADAVGVAADFRVVDEQDPTTSLTATPRVPDELAAHTWEVDSISTGDEANDQTEIDKIKVDYDFNGDEATFENLDNDDITVTLTRTVGGNPDRSSTISVTNDSSVDGSSAVFDLSEVNNTNIRDDPDNDNLVVEIDGDTLAGEGVKNPDSEGDYTATLTLENYAGDEFDVSAVLTISDDAFFEITAVQVPGTYTIGDEFDVDYTVENTGGAQGTQDIELLVDGALEATDSGVTLGDGGSDTRTLSYTPQAGDPDPLPITIRSDNDRDSETIAEGGFDLAVDPSDAVADAKHTWSISEIDENEFYDNDVNFDDDEEIDEIEVDYSSEVSLDGLDEDDITVTMTRELSDGPDRRTISVNSDDYNGDTATFRLSGNFTTELVNDPDGNDDLIVEIGDTTNGVDNPSAGDYQADITLIGENSNERVYPDVPFTID